MRQFLHSTYRSAYLKHWAKVEWKSWFAIGVDFISLSFYYIFVRGKESKRPQKTKVSLDIIDVGIERSVEFLYQKIFLNEFIFEFWSWIEDGHDQEFMKWHLWSKYIVSKQSLKYIQNKNVFHQIHHLEDCAISPCLNVWILTF